MRIKPEEIFQCYSRANELGLLSEEDTTVHFISRAMMHQQMDSVRSAFPANAMHTVAIKANPLTGVLNDISEYGFGLEAASYEEVMHANAIGCSIIGWDSPAKTMKEIEAVVTKLPHVIINCDSLEEAVTCSTLKPQNKILLRINPEQTGTAHQSMSVGGTYSKFGEAVSNREGIIKALLQHEETTGLHVHTSSQTTNFQELVSAIRKVLDLANEINSKRNKPLSHLNIGGGFPVNYSSGEELRVSAYADLLKLSCPELFDGTLTMITEFGRYYHAHAGFSITQVAQVKRFKNRQVIICHAGADMFLREAYQPNQWQHSTFLLAPAGKPKRSAQITTDIAGPLCFGGDYIQKEIEFKQADAGDLIAIQDTGANSIGLWSKHCSRAFPKCIMYDDDEMKVIRDRDTIDRNLSFWS